MVETFITGQLETNAYVLSKGKDCVVIDPGLDFEESAKVIKSKYNVLAVLLTHGHVDHIDGIRFFDCPIYISKEDEICLKDKQYSLYSWFDGKIPFDISKFEVIKVKDNQTIDLLDESIKVISTPGHTSGSVSYLYKDRLFSGDTLFKEAVGRTDLPSGNNNDVLKSLIKLIDNIQDNSIVYPGHGPKSTIRDERKNNFYYKEAKRRF